LDIHEHPSISKRSRDIFEEGMTFSIEPGLYFQGGFGIRLEDIYYLSQSGIKQITLIDKNKPIII